MDLIEGNPELTREDTAASLECEARAVDEDQGIAHLACAYFPAKTWGAHIADFFVWMRLPPVS